MVRPAGSARNLSAHTGASTAMTASSDRSFAILSHLAILLRCPLLKVDMVATGAFAAKGHPRDAPASYNARSGLGVTDTARAEKALKGIVCKRMTYHRPDKGTSVAAEG